MAIRSIAFKLTTIYERYYSKFDRRIKNPDPHIVALLAGSVAFGASSNLVCGCHRRQLLISKVDIDHLCRCIQSYRGWETKATRKSRKLCVVLQSLSLQIVTHRKCRDISKCFKMFSIAFQALPLRGGVITSLHKQLLKYSHKDDTHRGEYKRKRTPSVYWDKMAKWHGSCSRPLKHISLARKCRNSLSGQTMHFEKNRFRQLLIIANFIVEFLKIHPFEDGNGRLARVLTNLLLLRFKLPVYTVCVARADWG